MHQIYLTQGSFHIAAVASLLQHHIRVVILGLEVIRIMALVGNRRIGCDNGILRVTRIGTPHVFRTSHGHAVVITGSALGAHDIVVTVPLGQMRCLDAASVRTAFPDAFRIADDLFLLRVIFHHADRTGLFIAGTGFPVQGNDVLSAVIIVENGGIKTGGMQIYRLAPRTFDVLGSDKEVVHVKVSGIHGVHHAIDYIELVFLFAVGQTRRPDAFGRGQLFQVNLFVIGQHVGVQFPVLHILGMVDGNAGKPFKSGNCHVIIIALAADARIRIKTRENRIFKHFHFLLRLRVPLRCRHIPCPACRTA